MGTYGLAMDTLQSKECYGVVRKTPRLPSPSVLNTRFLRRQVR